MKLVLCILFITVFLVFKLLDAQILYRAAVASDNGNEPNNVTVTVNAVNAHSEMQATAVNASQIRTGALDNYDVFIVPGGWPYSTSRALGDNGCQKVADFVSAGGGYIGLCNGLYCIVEGNIGDGYSSNPRMRFLAGKLKNGSSWRRGHQYLNIEKVCENGDKVSLDYHNGPIIEPSPVQGLEPYKVLGTFTQSIGSPGSMVGEPAFAIGQFGNGRVIGSVVHPEKSSTHKYIFHNAIKWAAQGGTFSSSLCWADVFEEQPVNTRFSENRNQNDFLTIFPNPFSTSVDIRLNSSTVPQFHSSTVKTQIKIFNLNGRRVSNQTNRGTVELQHCGTYYRWHAQDQPPGQYIIRADMGDRVLTKKATLLR
jgi:hypothetical protein